MTNGFLRYTCDWEREGILIIPTDEDREMQLISFFTESAVLPPAGEPVGLDTIWQISPIGREYAGRPGDPTYMTAHACAEVLRGYGYGAGTFGVMGDESSSKYWDILREQLPKARFFDAKVTISRMQHVRTVAEQSQIRCAAQLIDIGYQAMCYVLRPGVTDREMFAAFTFAQMVRGGEWGDGYQIGINQWGTHVGKPYGHVVRPGDLINLYALGGHLPRLHCAIGPHDGRRRDHRSAGDDARDVHRRCATRRAADPSGYPLTSCTTLRSPPTSSAGT